MDKAKKMQTKKIVTWVLLAALVAGLAAMPLLAKNKTEADGPVASILSGTVEQGSISTAIRGGGTLSVDDTEEIRIPTGVKITEFLVKNGDRVTEGTPLAAVDKVSVMTAITAVTETMDYLQVEMRDAKNEKVNSTISATAGGRIKKVYAQNGDNVQRIMLEHGALALLSLDGLMAVKIERKMDLPTGQSVEVMLSDKTVVTGRVESNLSGEIIITIEDKGYAIGEKATVFTNDSDRVGSGELYVHNPWTATAYSGTIQTANAKEETKVTSGTTLFTLSDTSYQGDLQYLSALHREYEALMQDLFEMYNSGTINAPCTGMVEGVDKDSVHLLAADDWGNVQVELLTATEQNWTLVLLADTTPVCSPTNCPLKGNHSDPDCENNRCIPGTDCPANPDKHTSDCIFSCTPSSTEEGCNGTKYHYSTCIKDCDKSSESGKCSATAYHYLSCIESCNPMQGENCPATGTHHLTCIKSCIHSDGSKTCPAKPNHYTDCIESCIVSKTGEECPASRHKEACYFNGMEYTAQIAKVTAVGNDRLVVKWDSSGSYPVEKTSTGWKLKSGKKVDTSLLVTDGPTLPVANPSRYKVGDVVFYVTGKKGSITLTDVVVYSRSASSSGMMGDMSAMMSGMAGMMGGMSGMAGMSGMSGMGGTGAASYSLVDPSSLFDLNGSVLLTVTPETTASLSINLDEQDIAKIFVGQKATVKVQALGKETFEAEVVEVSNHGENNGGHSKFAVKLRFAKTHDMIDGMSATADLEITSQESVPVVPVAALAEQGSKTVIYTALDPDSGEPSKPVNVTIGASDGEYAEILEGLSLGDAYYYSYYDTVELDTSA